MELSLRWAERSRAAFGRMAGEHQALFGIVQGSTYTDLRARSAEALTAMDFPGYAIGGLAVGEGQAAMLATLDDNHAAAARAQAALSDGRRHTRRYRRKRCARHRHVRLRHADPLGPSRAGFHLDRQAQPAQRRFCRGCGPLDAASTCPAARDYSRAYLHHLFKAGEILGAMLLSWANIHFYQSLMAEARQAIAEARFAEFAAKVAAIYPGTPNGQRGTSEASEAETGAS